MGSFFFLFLSFFLLLQIPVTCYIHIYVHNSCFYPFDMGCFYCNKGTGNKIKKIKKKKLGQRGRSFYVNNYMKLSERVGIYKHGRMTLMILKLKCRSLRRPNWPIKK